jgi:hypothetical protein
MKKLHNAVGNFYRPENNRRFLGKGYYAMQTAKYNVRGGRHPQIYLAALCKPLQNTLHRSC